MSATDGGNAEAIHEAASRAYEASKPGPIDEATAAALRPLLKRREEGSEESDTAA